MGNDPKSFAQKNHVPKNPKKNVNFQEEKWPLQLQEWQVRGLGELRANQTRSQGKR